MRDKVTIVGNVTTQNLGKVYLEAREARLAIDAGEATSIAHLLQTEDDIKLCLCDKAAVKLVSFMELEKKAIIVWRDL